MTVFVAVDGVAPGVGKSTLCAGLVRGLAADGWSVDHFREEEILTRPAYAAVADEFRSAGVVRPQTLLAATRRFVGESTADVVVVDALFPYLPSLRAWGHSPAQLTRFLADLARIVTPVVLYLDDDPRPALERAIAREADPAWFTWYAAKLGAADLADAAAYLRTERGIVLRLLADWDLHVLPPGADRLDRAGTVLKGRLPAAAPDGPARRGSRCSARPGRR
jgi:thymidylate kinase